MEKLFSGKRGQGDRELGVSLGGLAFVASQGSPEEIDCREAILSIECFNNVDVGEPLWQTEPRDISSFREFASSHPSL